MIRKFFPLDKNYLLEEAQLSQQYTLLTALTEKVKELFEQQNNPLQLDDPFSLQIKKYKFVESETLNEWYLAIAGVYRYKFGDNQLEFLWGSESHLEKYKREWAAEFAEWTKRFCEREQFVQAVLDLTVFMSNKSDAQMAGNRMNFVMKDFFDVRIHKSRGIIAMKIA